MPGPFPGMDPYLEDPTGWPEVHNALADAIWAVLNRTLPDPYYARKDRRVVLADPPLPAGGIRVPDAGVHHRRPASPSGGTALLPGLRTEVTPTVLISEPDPPIELELVEVRDGEGADRLVTAVEIVSPDVKTGGADRRSYTRKQRQYARRGVSLVEIDLLRRGRRSPPALRVQALLERVGRRADYLVFVRRVRGRDAAETVAQPVSLSESLPVAPVPLRPGDGECPLDLQYAFNDLYDRGPFRKAVRYDRPPTPPLPPEYYAWAAERVAAWREGREPTVAPPGGGGEPDHGAGDEP